MEYLDTVKEKVADYIAREPVQETDEIISAYTLFAAIENCKKRLRHVGEIEKGLLDKLNDIYPQTVVKEKKGLFNKKTKKNYFSDICHYINKNDTELCLTIDVSYNCITLCKDYEYSDIYSIYSGLTEDAFDECEDEITTIFSELNYFGSLFANDNNKIEYNRRHDKAKLSNKINCDGFDLDVWFVKDYSRLGFDYDISINTNIASNGHANAHFYGQDNNVNKVINDNIVSILKNTPVNMSALSPMFYTIVTDYRRITAQDRIDEEIDKAFQKLYEKK